MADRFCCEIQPIALMLIRTSQQSTGFGRVDTQLHKSVILHIRIPYWCFCSNQSRYEGTTYYFWTTTALFRKYVKIIRNLVRMCLCFTRLRNSRSARKLYNNVQIKCVHHITQAQIYPCNMEQVPVLVKKDLNKAVNWYFRIALTKSRISSTWSRNNAENDMVSFNNGTFGPGTY